MCVISMVMDTYRERWPWPGLVPTTPTSPWVPNVVPNIQPSPVDSGGLGGSFTITYPTKEKTALEAFEELCAAAKKLDEILGLPDCEDPAKATWLETVRQRVREHEVEKIEKRLNG